MSQVKQLPPHSEKVALTREQFGALVPGALAYISPNENKFTQWTITPRREPGAGLAQVSIIVPANKRSGALQIQNMGRVGAEPSAGQDDLRPLLVYAIGTGKQGVNFVLKNHQTNTLQHEETF
jgi:hypothetical protein